MSLGSWRTFERIPFEQGLAVMEAARDAGICFLDDARYNDDTGTAPLKSGYSEVLFGELFRAAGWPRDETVVANKLWWEFWPDESALDEIDGSLGRTKLDHIDVEYACPLPEGLERRRGGRPDRRGDRGRQGARVGRRQLAGGGDRRGGTRREGAGSPGALRGTASLQPRLAIVGRGPGDDLGGRRGRCGRRRVGEPRVRRAEREVRRGRPRRPDRGRARRIRAGPRRSPPARRSSSSASDSPCRRRRSPMPSRSPTRLS